jgi:hypothetical protein
MPVIPAQAGIQQGKHSREADIKQDFARFAEYYFSGFPPARE